MSLDCRFSYFSAFWSQNCQDQHLRFPFPLEHPLHSCHESHIRLWQYGVGVQKIRQKTVTNPPDHELDTTAGLQRTILQFDHLHRALIDASSIIYMMKAGYFDRVRESLELHSPERIIAETGYRDLRIRPIREDNRLQSADESLVQRAILLKWPVITEDGGIIRQLAKQSLPYFNALMMLEFLFFRHLISPEEYSSYLEKLLQHAWYGPEIVSFGEAVHQTLKGSGRNP